MAYVQTEYNNQSFPFSTTCYIVSTWRDGTSSIGTGVIVGKNDVLTAAHVVYSASKGAATSVTVTPGYDSTPNEAPFGSYSGRLLNYYTGFDPNNVGAWAGGDRNASTRGGAELDFAIIGLDRNIGRDVGVMWIDPYAYSGTYNITGYPGVDSGNPQIASGFLSADAVDYYFNISNFESHPGNSGGPVWQWWSIHGYVGGIVSTGSNGVGGAAGQISGSFTDIATWMNGNDYLVGGSGGYFINGNGGSETLVGGAGGDQINGWGGYDVIYGGGGDDIILSSAYYIDTDVVYGGTGADRIFGGGAADYLFGESGADSLYGDGGADWMDGGADADTLTGADGDDNLTGGAGADRLDGEGGWDTARYDYSGPIGLFMSNGGANTGDAAGDSFVSVEVISASWYNDTLEGDSGSNALSGLGGRDFISGLQGNDYLYGGTDSDTLRGGTGGDYQDGGEGYDYVTYDTAGSAVYAYLQWAGYNFGDAAGDTFVGVEGLIGSGFGDVLIGDTGGNAIFGGNGGDWMDGLSGIDYLYGDAGNDALVGGTGNDNLNGGAGTDTFWINAGDLIPGEIDTIADFAVGEKLYMSKYVAGLTGFQNWYGGALMTVYTTWGGNYYVFAAGVTGAQLQADTQFIL